MKRFLSLVLVLIILSVMTVPCFAVWTETLTFANGISKSITINDTYQDKKWETVSFTDSSGKKWVYAYIDDPAVRWVKGDGQTRLYNINGYSDSVSTYQITQPDKLYYACTNGTHNGETVWSQARYANGNNGSAILYVWSSTNGTTWTESTTFETEYYYMPFNNAQNALVGFEFKVPLHSNSTDTTFTYCDSFATFNSEIDLTQDPNSFCKIELPVATRNYQGVATYFQSQTLWVKMRVHYKIRSKYNQSVRPTINGVETATMSEANFKAAATHILSDAPNDYTEVLWDFQYKVESWSTEYIEIEVPDGSQRMIALINIFMCEGWQDENKDGLDDRAYDSYLGPNPDNIPDWGIPETDYTDVPLDSNFFKKGFDFITAVFSILPPEINALILIAMGAMIILGLKRAFLA